MTNEKPKSQQWEPIKLTYLGKVSEIILFPGTGKLSLPFDDMGDSPKKPKGQE
jgi:hypothetical protein